MRKRILAVVMALMLCGTSLQYIRAGAKDTVLPSLKSRMSEDGWYDVGDWDDNDDLDDSNWDTDSGLWDDDTDNWDNDNWDDDSWDDEEDDDDSWDDEEEDDDSWDDVTLSLTDISVNPKNKIVKKGKSFYIEIVPANKSDWVSSEDWEEACGDNIASVEFTSTKNGVASASKFNGKVKGKKKGTAVIKTKITLINNETITLKTKVTVKK